jgi:hypothetical protein
MDNGLQTEFRKAAALDERELRDRIEMLEDVISRAPCEKGTSFAGLQVMPECHRIWGLEERQWCGACKLKRKAGLLPEAAAQRDGEG